MDRLTDGPGTAAGGEGGAESVPEDASRRRRTMGPARKAALVAGVVVLALLGLFTWGVASGNQQEGAFAPSALDGKLAPAIDGRTIDGGAYSLDRERGRWVVVNFFATWCPPCVKEHPELITFEQRHAATGDRKVVSVVFGGPDEAESARKFFERNGGSWPVVIDPTGTLAVDYAVAKVPESILVSPTGLVYGKIRGGVTADELDAIIDDVEAQAARS